MKFWPQKAAPVAPEFPPKNNRWPTILGITVAAWALLGGLLIFLLQTSGAQAPNP